MSIHQEVSQRDVTRVAKRRAACRALAGVVAGLAISGSALGQPLELSVPAGILPPEVPETNPPTQEKSDLGQQLFFDTRLSTDGTIACASCHDPAHGFADPRNKATSEGVAGAVGTRNAPTVLNSAFLVEQFWDGREPTLEAQAIQPLINPVEHGFPDHAAVVATLREIPEYAASFKAAFGSDEITVDRIGQAIATFERTLISVDAPIDRYLAGDSGAISDAAQRGWALYNGKARCVTCHGRTEVLPFFTDDLYHNIGVGVTRIDFNKVTKQAVAAVNAGTSLDELALNDAETSELGRFLVTLEARDIGAFKTPPLRNVALTAPYMHDGSEKTLEDVIAFYDRGGNDNPHLDGGMRPLGLTNDERADLVELLKTFTSSDLARFKSLNALTR